MSHRSLLPEAVERYVERLSANEREAPSARRLREETARMPNGGMQIGPDQAALLALLVRAIGARRALEVGTFTGYSALAVAQALPADGSLVCCDVSDEWTSVARRYWRETGVDAKIELRLAPARETLDALLRAPGPGSFDFAFVDADKTGYDGYYDQCLELVRPGGLVAFDNMLWSGKVADAEDHGADTLALRALNAKAHRDPRVDACLLTVGDGVLLVRRR
ncbi:MAG TPA: class I SAM-dependent methyltransferase [Casimicrobiaceae bacterium]|nr:class I SAM-dependent methyltransferase [Casimicrobiaceae bacterium]